jgi:hypothetical protein
LFGCWNRSGHWDLGEYFLGNFTKTNNPVTVMMDNNNIPLLNVLEYFLALLKGLFLSCFHTRSSWSVRVLTCRCLVVASNRERFLPLGSLTHAVIHKTTNSMTNWLTITN